MPSHVAQYETPRPRSARSLGSPNSRGEAPQAKMTAFASYTLPSPHTTRLTSPSRDTSRTFPVFVTAPKRSACFCIACANSNPPIPSGKPG